MSPRRTTERDEGRDGCPRNGRCVFLKIVGGLSGCYNVISFELCVWVQRCVSLVADSDAPCRCGWVCMTASGGGGDGRNSMFCRGIEF